MSLHGIGSVIRILGSSNFKQAMDDLQFYNKNLIVCSSSLHKLYIFEDLIFIAFKSAIVSFMQ